jgi:hypothetical protein
MINYIKHYVSSVADDCAESLADDSSEAERDSPFGMHEYWFTYAAFDLNCEIRLELSPYRVVRADFVVSRGRKRQ